MKLGLVVRQPFGKWPAGTVFLSKSDVDEILAGPNAGHCIAFTRPDDPPADAVVAAPTNDQQGA